MKSGRRGNLILSSFPHNRESNHLTLCVPLSLKGEGEEKKEGPAPLLNAPYLSFCALATEGEVVSLYNKLSLCYNRSLTTE